MNRSMKDSQVIWIGDIPSDWHMVRIKNTSWLKGRIGWDGLKSSEFTDNGPYLITGTDFQNGKVNWATCVHITSARYNEDLQLHIKEGDLLITKDGTIGKLAIAENCPEEVSLNSGVMIIRNISEWKYVTKYMYYILASDIFTQWFTSEQKPGSTIKHLYQHQFGEFRFPLPSIDEQNFIVQYLNDRCIVIDEAIKRHHHIIEKLEELKKSVVFAIITRGLNVDKYEPSSIPWCPKIPENWTPKRIKYSIKITNGSNPTTEGNIPVYGSGATSFKTCGEHKDAPTVLLGRKGATLHIPHYIDHSYWNVDTAFDTKPKGKVNMKWFYYVAMCLDYKYYINQTTLPSMTQTDYNNMAIPTPPYDEQNAIAEYIDARIKRIDEEKEKHLDLIVKLEEYRKSIIYQAVTGKIDCREVQNG